MTLIFVRLRLGSIFDQSVGKEPGRGDVPYDDVAQVVLDLLL